jgi:hypothetical protein
LSARPSAFIKSPYFFFVHAPVLPLPGFLVAALMDAYTTDAGILCLVAIYATRKRAREAGVDPVESTTHYRTEGSVCSGLDLESCDRTSKGASRMC